MPIPNKTAADIEQALRDFDTDKRSNFGNWEVDPRHKYAIEWGNRRYPVKEIIRMATGYENFSGGDEDNKYLKTLGFTIVTMEDTENSNVWIFQANPSRYDLIADLKNLKIGDKDTWDVTRYSTKMNTGDTVLLWSAGADAGIYAIGKLTTEPRNTKDGIVVPFRYTQILDSPILRQEIKTHPILKKMLVIRSPAGTNFPVQKEEWEVLRSMIESRKTNGRIWKISAGQGGKDWELFRDNGFAGIGFTDSFKGDLSRFVDKNALSIAIKQAAPNTKIQYLIDQLWYIRDEIKVGDIVLAYGNNRFLGVGTIDTPYQFVENDDSVLYPHRRHVNWDQTFQPVSVKDVSKELRENMKHRKTIIPLTHTDYQEVINAESETIAQSTFTAGELASYFAGKGFQFNSQMIATFITALETKGFVILSGLSGTGKTKLAEHLVELLPQIERQLSFIDEKPADDNEITITVKPYMLKYNRIIVPRIYWPLIEIPPIGEWRHIILKFEQDEQQVRLMHASYSSEYLQIMLQKKARQWFVKNLEDGETVILHPFDDDNDDFAGFTLQKPGLARPTRHEKLPNHLFLSVRPDWRDNKSLLGYYNPLIGEYADTPFLRFLLRAKHHYDQHRADALPHFIILDEMNLARVEYYFADFLSVLESRRGDDGCTVEALRLHSQDAEQTFGAQGMSIPQSLNLPPNLYIIGTVNMDETTHAFSPKVLDRAFTIEFNAVDFNNYPPAANTNGQIDPNTLRQKLLVDFQRNGDFTQIKKPAIAKFIDNHPDYRTQLQTLNNHLTPFDLHFGYRVFDEIMQFMAIAQSVDLFETDDEALDRVVLMKVLPKFNGPRNRLRQPLETVINWAKNPASDGTETVDSLNNSETCRKLLQTGLDDFTYPTLAHKALRMLIRLHETGFAGFA